MKDYQDKNNYVNECKKDTDCDPKVNYYYYLNLKIYVTWIGTDIKGDYLTSGGIRISRFA